METAERTSRAGEIMLEFARITGLDPVMGQPKRYLWTDAFAVCNYLSLYTRTGNDEWRDLALRLVDQVHAALGRHREDDERSGWISGLPEDEGWLYPTRGGLRIGKPLNERRPGERYNERLEWDQDGQYFHYLTKWMHALNRVSRVTGDRKFHVWAVDLAHAAYQGFTYRPVPGGPRRMYWKMSIDLSRPLVPSMGQHDPLDGFVTFSELQLTAGNDSGHVPGLDEEINGMAGICRGMALSTDDPLGLGGLLADASRLAQLAKLGGTGYEALLDSVLVSAEPGVRSFAEGTALAMPPDYRLAFRELGLAIGLEALGSLQEWVGTNPKFPRFAPALKRRIQPLVQFVPVAGSIENFWMNPVNQEVRSWRDHREINMVMLATALAPDGFLAV